MFDFLIHVAAIACIYSILALSLNLQAGFAGMMNFGLIAMFGCGMYAAALVHRFGWSALATLPLAAVAATLLGLFFARLGRKLSSDYWGIATLSIAEIMRIFSNNLETVTGGAQGVSGLPLLFASLRPWDGVARLALFSTLLLAALWLCDRITRSAFGLSLKLMREEPQLALSLGYDIDKIRARMMVISSAIAALAGVLYAYYLTFVGPEQLVAPETFLIWSMIMLGGIANNRGVIAGAFLMQFAMAFIPFVKDYLALPSDFVAAARLFVTGGGILLFLLLRPQGIFPERIGGYHGR
ncbi:MULTISPECIES: branched-chain amino acid ABC transporter permease [unclassified Rhizobium]|uniref:branched-chain amino acid ABC transporter permease n=1 Tax=unclassified Rhizobium TaxID=2613769 RepID=UPI0024798FE8|nr:MULTISPECIES: branched-chain amino acid ABC transporter permease [unclassified Rhizobium]MDH7804568.1 branched-chain amino acid transport system permease protein [Rhizobium sp. AN70]